MLLTLAFVAVCCSEEVIDAPTTNEKGEDVQFNLSFDALSRTIYGPATESTNPIYWSEGDNVLIGSPQCAQNRNFAVYEVTPVEGENYASALTNISDVAVQWGSGGADFYSVYPSTEKWESLTNASVAAKLNIESEQSANIVLDGTTYSAADMNNVIMYARTAGVEKGKTVKLQYTPYSTMLEFELNIGENVDSEGNKTGKYGSLKVFSMILTAPKNTPIAGDFNITLNGKNEDGNYLAPTIKAVGNNTNVIKMVFETQPVLNETNKTLKAKVALIPIGMEELSGWTVSFEVLEGTDTETKTYTKTLNINKQLLPGQIHKIKLPSIYSTTAWTPILSKWITTLYDYKNIYLTELSLPGAWYAGAPTDEDYQATSDVSTLWNAGVRAFATECRSSSTLTWNGLSPSYVPSSIVISGTQDNGVLGNYTTGGTKIRTVIKSIADAVATTVKTDENGNQDGEFAVLVLSYADGGNDGHRDQDHAYFINGVKTEIANSGATNIYSDAITSKTTVKDVLGKLIIKVNVDDNIPIGSYQNDMNALLSYNPFVQQLKPEANEEAADFAKIRYSNLYWKAWEDTYKKFASLNTTDFLWCFSSANRTQVDTGTNTSIPTYAQRQKALNSMIEQSKEITAAGTHNVWFYFNAGGTQTTSQTDGTTSGSTFASTMNPWLLDVIKLKANGGTNASGEYVESNPSTLGLVFFNYCTDESKKGPAIIKEIIEMNNKFKLQRATPKLQTTYASSATYGGNVISLD